MNCSEARRAIDALLDREIDREEEILLRSHLHGCAGCAKDLGERRAFSEAVAVSFEGALDGVESTAAERARLSARLSGRKGLPLARVAALAVVALSVGLVAWALARSRSEAEFRAVAERIRELETREGQVEKLREEAVHELDGVRRAGADLPGLDVAVWNLESRLAPPAPVAADLTRLVSDTASRDASVRGAARAALRQVAAARSGDLRAVSRTVPCDRRFVDQVVADLEGRGAAREIIVSQDTNGVQVEVRQGADGGIRVSVPGRTIEAQNMADLRARFPAVCLEYAIAGADGRIRVGSNSAALDLSGRFGLLFRTGGYDEDLPFEVYQAWSARAGRDEREVEKDVRDLRDLCRSAGNALPVPQVTVDLDAILRDVRTLTRQELEKTRQRIEAQAKEMEQRYRDMSELRQRVRGLRVFAEGVRKGD